jgi:hypothetical protein
LTVPLIINKQQVQMASKHPSRAGVSDAKACFQMQGAKGAAAMQQALDLYPAAIAALSADKLRIKNVEKGLKERAAPTDTLPHNASFEQLDNWMTKVGSSIVLS